MRPTSRKISLRFRSGGLVRTSSVLPEAISTNPVAAILPSLCRVYTNSVSNNP
ncbi:hypothetical protein J2X71_000589 [Rhizobium sp. 1399]|nr:hypothetical protein [Rhizobium sp. 1399]